MKNNDHLPTPHLSDRQEISLTWWWAAAVVWAAFVLLGSWYPFNYREGDFSDAWNAWGARGLSGGYSRPDVAVNLLLGVPLGFFLGLALPTLRKGAAWARLILAVVVVAFVFFWGTLVELGQFWFGGRVTSFADTIAQTFGGIVGVVACLFGGNWFLSRVGAFVFRRREERKATVFLELYLAGYAAWMLMPFLPALTPGVLAARWRSGAIDPIPFGNWLSDPLSGSYNAAVALVTAAPIGVYFERRSRKQVDGTASWTTAILAAGLFVAFLELGQVFIETRTASADDLIWSVVGAALGVIGSRYLNSDRDQKRAVHAPSQQYLGFGLGLIAFALVYMIVAWAPFDLIDSEHDLRARLSQFLGSPIGSLLAGGDYLGFSNLIRTFFWSAPLGSLAVLTAKTAPTTMKWMVISIVCVLVVSVCVATESGQLLLRHHNPNLIALAVRLLGCFCGAWVTGKLVVSG